VSVLVTGGTGFVGQKVVHALRSRELPVRALVREPKRGETLRSWGAELVAGDVTDRASLARAVEGADQVVHLVAIITGSPRDFERTMSVATRDLVAVSKEAGVRRFVLMSALGVSEATKDLVPYYRAKWEMEQAVETSGLEHVIFRPSFVFGRDGGVLPMFVRQVRWSPVVPVVGSGENRLQPVWVDDVAEFFARSVDRPGVAGRTFELGGPDRVTWNELYERIKRTLGARRPLLHLPPGLVRAAATVVERLPKAPITRDQLTMLLAGDNVCEPEPAAQAFGVELTPLDEQLRRSVTRM
jgi:NADH dehydrogenase